MSEKAEPFHNKAVKQPCQSCSINQILAQIKVCRKNRERS